MTPQVKWRKTSYSGMTDNSSCVEIARLTGAVGVRDSKDPGAGSLLLSVESFGGLVARIKRGELGR